MCAFTRRPSITALAASALLLLGVAGASCTLDDTLPNGDGAGDSATVDQPVFLQPVFELEGLADLPAGIQLHELHLGVGAIFLDLVHSEDGIAYANRTPFRLHFYIRDGRVTAEAPPMVLPEGGRYQVSVQVEPQVQLAREAGLDGVRSLESGEEEASLLVAGSVTEVSFTRSDDDQEPAPLPWQPITVDTVDQLQRHNERIPFTYTSQRNVRFVIDEVVLSGGQDTDLVMQLPVGHWIRETVSPALQQALSERTEGQPSTERIDEVNLDLTERIGSGDGIDGLIGGMALEIR